MTALAGTRDLTDEEEDALMLNEDDAHAPVPLGLSVCHCGKVVIDDQEAERQKEASHERR